MEIDVSIMVVWSMAFAEAKGTGWNEIEPHHLLCGILKFAELPPDLLVQAVNSPTEEEQLTVSHSRLAEYLSKQCNLGIPEDTTALRHTLRHKAVNKQKADARGGSAVLHRSEASREAYRQAELTADDSGRDSFDVTDLTSAILAQRNKWIVQAMEKLGLRSEASVVASESIEKWENIIHQIEPHKSADINRIKSDPLMKVLTEMLAKDTDKPYLLVSDGQRRGIDVMEEFVRYRQAKDSQTIKVFVVYSRSLLESVFSEDAGSATEMLEWMKERANSKCLFYFDALHRYLLPEVAGEIFITQFHSWLQKVDGRFLFGISGEKYHSLIEKKMQWKGVFQVIWVHNNLTGKDFVL